MIGTHPLIDIVHEAVETHSNPWAILSAWQVWKFDNETNVIIMTVCTGGVLERVLCTLLTDPTSDELHRWLYVDISDAILPRDSGGFPDSQNIDNWLENYMLTSFPETVTALADGHALVALEIREFAERLGDYRLRGITGEECANKETSS